MIVRTADREDLLGVGRVAEAAHWVSYDGLLRPEVIGRLLARDFSPSAIGRRLLRGGLLVATHDDEVVGFADGIDGADRLVVSAIATDPDHRRRGIGTALLAGLRSGAATLPPAIDVLLGHIEAEQFLEANGFAPGEIQQRDLFGEEVVERRWWAEAGSALTALQQALGGR
jgi:GNAT superfamily N-acetyltransferase